MRIERPTDLESVVPNRFQLDDQNRPEGGGIDESDVSDPILDYAETRAII
ncbi:MAG: hypothetical protein ACLQT6_12775 [Desulfomonilaceae bacterium]